MSQFVRVLRLLEKRRRQRSMRKVLRKIQPPDAFAPDSASILDSEAIVLIVRGNAVDSEGQITRLLRKAASGDEVAHHRLFERVYSELRTIARAQRRRLRPHNTLNTTALINEAYLRLAKTTPDGYRDRTHFYATASKAMRQILVSYGRRICAAKRGGDQTPSTLTDVAADAQTTFDEVLAIDQVLVALEKDSPRRCRIFECRVFGGMTIAETAAALEVSPATIKREWSVISAWVYREVGRQ